MRDVTAAPYMGGLWQMAKHTYIDNSFNPDEKKSKLLFFAGGVRHNEPSYSGGVRQELHNTYKDGHDPDVQVRAWGWRRGQVLLGLGAAAAAALRQQLPLPCGGRSRLHCALGTTAAIIPCTAQITEGGVNDYFAQVGGQPAWRRRRWWHSTRPGCECWGRPLGGCTCTCWGW